MKTYPEMNQKIVGILRIGGDENPHHLYAAQRIEELEYQVKRYREEVQALENLSELQDRLLACYRVGKHPGTVLDKLKEAREKVSKFLIDEVLKEGETE